MIDNEFVPLRISLRGITEPLNDPRVVEAAMQAMRFRKAKAIGIEAGGCTAVLRPGHRAWAKTGTGSSASTLSSNVITTAERIARRWRVRYFVLPCFRGILQKWQGA